MTRLPYTDKLCDDLRHDTGPAESDYIDEHDDTPIVAPDALASAAIVMACIVAGVVIAVWLWLTA